MCHDLKYMILMSVVQNTGYFDISRSWWPVGAQCALTGHHKLS